PRGVRFDGQDNLLVVERLKGIVALTQRNDGTCVGWEKRTVISQADLEHGIEIGPIPGKKDEKYLYASSQESVFRWEYDPESRHCRKSYLDLTHFPDHVTRTLLLQSGANGQSEYLNVSHGSAGNFDETAVNCYQPMEMLALLKSVVSPSPTKTAHSGLQPGQGAVLAWGVRNSVGIALSKDGKDLWGIENSSDDIVWRDVDVHVDNPAEELNRILLRDLPELSQMTRGARILKTTTLPVSFQAHSAPLHFVFYDNSKCSPRDNNVGLSRKWDGDAFVCLHSSWNRQPPTGYSVIRIPWAGDAPAAPSNSAKGYEHIV
ncbi:hypothetical protein FRC11_002063, partial [Ceratobasidium sp. 423]